MEHASSQYIATQDATIFVSVLGSGPPVLLLHGFPETHLMWRHVAPLLANDFTVVMADLRGYGKSSCPPSTEDHYPYSKRSMGNDMVEVMERLGFPQFAVVGHDRGGRVAYRMALDHPKAVSKLAIFDIMPTDVAWRKADARMMLAFWPWSILAQPSPLPERILETAAADIVNSACDHWGTSVDSFTPDIRNTYTHALRDPQHAHAVCEEYRAAATIDRAHDDADQKSGNMIKSPTLVLWAAAGGVDTWYAEAGGPLELWRNVAPNVVGEAVAGGHFFPEENPEVVATKLKDFLKHYQQ